MPFVVKFKGTPCVLKVEREWDRRAVRNVVRYEWPESADLADATRFDTVDKAADAFEKSGVGDARYLETAEVAV